MGPEQPERGETSRIPLSSPPRTLEQLREDILEVDSGLLGLLNRRAALSLAVGEIKRGGTDDVVFRPGREAELLKRLEAMNTGPLPKDHLRAIYREIFSSSRYLQRPQRVAFLGPEGTFSHIAGRALLGSLASFHPQPSLADVFRAVEDEDCDIGIVPLENSLQGSIGQTLDLFMTHSGLHIRAETTCAVRHSLLSTMRDLTPVQCVYSHPQPLAQCGNWLRNNVPAATLLPVESTAAAARLVTHEKNAAAIAHVSLADTLGLHVLAQGIEDAPGNRTRFVVLGRTPADRPGASKTSILFSVVNRPGSLFAVLKCFADRSMNMNKLESRPMQGEPGNYVFFADLECDIGSDSHQDVLEEVRAHCLLLRVLGSYPVA
jgi:chorismate mutase/prephenate dehydratase